MDRCQWNGAVVLHQGCSAHPGDMWQYLETVLVITIGGLLLAFSMLISECCQTSYNVVGQPSTIKNDLDPDANSAKVEEPLKGEKGCI